MFEALYFWKELQIYIERDVCVAISVSENTLFQENIRSVHYNNQQQQIQSGLYDTSVF